MPAHRRDRHGRGLRGALAPPDVPLARSRAEDFAVLVAESLARLARGWPDQLRAVRPVVEDVPPPVPDGAGDPVPLGRWEPAGEDRPAAVVVYRRPVEARSGPGRPRALLVHDVVVEQVADLLGVDPATVDPEYGEQ